MFIEILYFDCQNLLNVEITIKQKITNLISQKSPLVFCQLCQLMILLLETQVLFFWSLDYFIILVMVDILLEQDALKSSNPWYTLFSSSDHEGVL